MVEAHMRTPRFLTAALLVLTACGGDGLLASTRFVRDLRAALARWESSGIDSYELTVRRLCECNLVAPVRVTVDDGAVVSRIIVSTGDPVPASLVQYYPDVPGLFAIIEHAHANGADGLRFEFHPSYGFPTAINIDWAQNAVDDEVGYRMEDFAPLP
jgi:hypothetical protein